MKVAVAAKLSGEPSDVPHMPCPPVQPRAVRAPNPISAPLSKSRGTCAPEAAGRTPPAVPYASEKWKLPRVAANNPPPPPATSTSPDPERTPPQPPPPFKSYPVFFFVKKKTNNSTHLPTHF